VEARSDSLSGVVIRMKGYGIEQIAPIAIIFVVAFFIFSIGSVIMQDIGEEFCDYTWITNTTIATGANISGNPSFNDDWYGCCITTDTGNNCTEWDTTKTSMNISGHGLDSLEEMSSWGPTLALVVIAAIIIGVLITYLARGSRV